MPPRTLPLITLLLTQSVCAVAIVPRLAAQDPSDEQRIRELRTESNEAIARQDVEGFLASLAADYRASTSSGALLDSPRAMGEAFADRFATSPDALYVRTTATVELSASEPVAAEAGTWVGSWTTPEGPFRTGGRYLAYWSRETGDWLIHSELFVPLFCEGAGCGMDGPGE